MATERSLTFTYNGQPVKIDYWGNFDIKNPGNIKEVTFVQHGISNNADGYAKYAEDSAKLHGEKAGEWGVIALEFEGASSRESDNPHWRAEDWKFGHLSPESATGPRISSFTVVDEFVKVLAQNAGSLEEVTFSGHSAGGQFVSRYAAGGDFSPLETAGVEYNFVAANPSSWLEFNEAVDYPYGTGDLNNYMAKRGVDGLEDQFSKLDFTIFAGTKDTGTADLDMSSAAMRQGDNRLERAEWYHDHLKDIFNSPTHDIEYAEGVGHSGGGMFRHEDGQDLLWG